MRTFGEAKPHEQVWAKYLRTSNPVGVCKNGQKTLSDQDLPFFTRQTNWSRLTRFHSSVLPLHLSSNTIQMVSNKKLFAIWK